MRVLITLCIGFLLSCNSDVGVVEYEEVDSLQLRNKHLEATAILRRMYSNHPEDSELAFRLAHSLTYTGSDLEEINSLLTKSLEIDPDNKKARFVRAQGLMFKGRFDEAVSDLETLSIEQPEHPLIQALLVQALLMSNRLDDCKARARKALKSQLPYEEAELIYKSNILANYFQGHMDTASWDTAFLPDRGFRKDTVLARLIYKKELDFEEFAVGGNVRMNALTLTQLEDAFK